MNIELLKLGLKRFAKGLLSFIGAAALQYLLSQIPLIVHALPGVVTSNMWLAIFTAGLLALEKLLQGYRPQ